MINLYLFNENDSAARFGIGTYLNELTHALEGTDIRVHIVHLRSARPDFEIEKTDETENWYIPEVRNQNTFDGPIQKVEYYYRNVIYLLRINIKDTRDLIFHFNYNQCFALAKGLKEVFDCKTVTAIHFMKWQLELHGNLSRFHTLKSKPETLMNPFEKLLATTDEYEGCLYKEVDRVIALSSYTKKILINEYQIEPKKISVIPNGLTDRGPVTQNGKDDLRRKWRLYSNEFVILFVGRLHAVKGLVYLIRAFHKVLDKIPDCRLVIAGSGNYDFYIREVKNICTKVTFTGLLEKKELYELYRIADIGVMPSFHEQCSYVAIEMMMHGVPLIASTTTGLKEMVEDGNTGLQIPVVEHPERVEIDSELLAEKILNLLLHPNEEKKTGRSGREKYLKEYSLEVFRRNMLNFYTSLF